MKQQPDYKKIREERVKSLSKERLLDIASKKIKTTMIGSLDTIEKKLGFLRDGESEYAEEFKELFNQIRSEILDRGNSQIRNLEAEFSQYEIVYKKNSFILPTINKDKEDGR